MGLGGQAAARPSARPGRPPGHGRPTALNSAAANRASTTDRNFIFMTTLPLTGGIRRMFCLALCCVQNTAPQCQWLEKAGTLAPRPAARPFSLSGSRAAARFLPERCPWLVGDSRTTRSCP
jgi:hypothetical protein